MRWPGAALWRSGGRAACATDPGGRAEQQDRAACFASRDGSCHLLVVADGMGGHDDGARAARLVTETAEQLWRGLAVPPSAPAEFLETLCQQAHEAIRRVGRENGSTPHSTVVALLATPLRAWWVHVGDSRLYGFRDGATVCRTEDHSWVWQLFRSGQIAEAEIGTHPARNRLLRGLGMEEALHTTHGQMRMSPHTGFVLCTDGFWAGVSSAEMAELLRSDDPAAACAHWTGVAAQRGGETGDNLAVAVLRPAGAAPLRHRQLWPLYGALGVALLVLAAWAA